MFSRSQLKESAKVILKKYYWKAVVVSLIAFLLTGGMGEVANSVNEIRDTYNSSYSEIYTEETLDVNEELKGVVGSVLGNGLVLLFVNVFIIAFALSLLIKLFISYPLTIGKNNFFMGIRQGDRSINSL